jgi:ankyrin repeat protein
MRRNPLWFGMLALSVTHAVVAGTRCSISDWPLEMPEGTADFARFVQPSALPVVTHVQQVTRTVSSHSGTAPGAPVGVAPAPPRDWKARRSPTPSAYSKLAYAVMDDDSKQLERLLKSTSTDLDPSLSSDRLGGLLNTAAELGEPDVARVLISHGVPARSRSGDPVALHPIADALMGLEGYLNTRDRPAPFFNAPPRSVARFVAVIHLLLDTGADPDARIGPSEDLTALGDLMLTPRFDGDVDLAATLIAHGASADGATPERSPLGFALQKGYDDYAAVLLTDRHPLSKAVLNYGVVMTLNNVALGRTLIEAGADPNFKIGSMPVLCRTLEVSERRTLALALLAHGADANADCANKAAPGSTPLTLVDRDDHELIDLLLARGGTLGVPERDAADLRSHGVDAGTTNWALLHRRDYLASALLARNPAAAHECGAVLYAARFGAASTLAQLLKLGEDPNSVSERGVSALMAAAYHGESGALEVLLTQPRVNLDRATPSHFNPEHFRIQLEGRSPPLFFGARTALMFAALGGSADSASLLLAHGARLHQQDAEGLEAADYARNAAVAHLLAGGN